MPERERVERSGWEKPVAPPAPESRPRGLPPRNRTPDVLFTSLSDGSGSEREAVAAAAEGLKAAGFLVVEVKGRAVLVVGPDAQKLMVGVQRCE